MRIFKELGSPSSFQWNVRESYSSIAKRLGVDEETVRKRIRRAEQQGIIRGWRLVLNPSLLGRESAYLAFDADDVGRKAALVSQLKLIDGVVVILDFQGRGLNLLSTMKATNHWSGLCS